MPTYRYFGRHFVFHDQEIGSDCDHAQATNLRFNWIIIIELYNVRNMPGKALKWGTLVKKTGLAFKKLQIIEMPTDRYFGRHFVFR
jgi:hypothetical protein